MAEAKQRADCRKRADRAEDAMRVAGEALDWEEYLPGAHGEDAVSDLMSDLLHLAHKMGGVALADKIHRRAWTHYEAERVGM